MQPEKSGQSKTDKWDLNKSLQFVFLGQRRLISLE